MSQSQNKKMRQIFRINSKKIVEDTAKKIIDQRVQSTIKKLEHALYSASRLRDVFIFIAIGNIIFAILWLTSQK